MGLKIFSANFGNFGGKIKTLSDNISVTFQNWAVFDGKFEIYVEFVVMTTGDGMVKVEF